MAVASLLLFGGASAGFAQEFQGSQIPGWSFTPGVAVSTVYDSNVALSSELPARPDTIGDQLFVVEPSGQLAYHGPRTTFDSGYRGNVRRYSDLDALDSFDQEAFASLRHRLTRRTTLSMSERFRTVPSTDELQLEGVRFTRSGSRTNHLTTGLQSRLTRYWDLNVDYDFNWVEFDQVADITLLLLRGGLTHSLHTELARRLNERASLGVEYGVRLADLKSRAQMLLFQDAGGTFHYELGQRTSFNAAGGVSQLRDRILNETRTGPYVRADVTHQLERASMGASYTQSWVPTFGFGGASESQGASAHVEMPVTHNRMYVQQSINWRRTNPLIRTTFPLDTWWVRSTVGYGISRWMRVQGYYVFTRQDADLPGGLIKRHRIAAQVVISEPMRIQ
jgi:hypothetical protein